MRQHTAVPFQTEVTPFFVHLTAWHGGLPGVWCGWFTMARRIEVVPHNPAWPRSFREEAEALIALFGSELLAVHHIGSTAIPGIPAKPIIDMLIVVSAIDLVDRYPVVLEPLGYLTKGEFGIPGRRFFIKGTEEVRSHHLHFFAHGHARVVMYLNFRDYLRDHPAEALAYGRLKERLAREFPEDPDRYMAGKEGLIQEINRRAQAWRG